MTQSSDYKIRRLELHGRGRGKARSPLALLGASAALLAAAAVANHLIAKRTERRHPPRGKFVDVSGVKVHYVERGAGPVVVMIHGNGVSSQDFELSGLIERLAVGRRVIAFDRPGFGYTQRPRGRPWAAEKQASLILDAMTSLGVHEATLAAHSWGTLVALQAAMQQPERVRGLILMSGYYWATPRVDVPLLSGPAVPGLGDVLRFSISPLLGWAITPLMMKQIFSPAKTPPKFKTGFQTGMSLRPSQLRATAADTMMMPFEAAKTSARHQEITAPVLVLTGDGDKIVSARRHSRRLARDLLAAQIHTIKGAGHMIHHTAPDEVACVIKAFLDLVDAEASAPLDEVA